MREVQPILVKFTCMEWRGKSLCNKWLNVNEVLAFENIINCNVFHVKNAGKYLQKN
jgi:hypothetical protein